MPYSVTKAAQLHLMRCLAGTQGPKIRVNAVLPGFLSTEWVSILVITFSKREVILIPPGREVRARQDQGHARESLSQARRQLLGDPSSAVSDSVSRPTSMMQPRLSSILPRIRQ
jgi:NAD(P)-dependent dehydrogenase (short-subunit alcohol dehydrogenase family)